MISHKIKTPVELTIPCTVRRVIFFLLLKSCNITCAWCNIIWSINLRASKIKWIGNFYSIHLSICWIVWIVSSRLSICKDYDLELFVTSYVTSSAYYYNLFLISYFKQTCNKIRQADSWLPHLKKFPQLLWDLLSQDASSWHHVKHSFWNLVKPWQHYKI